MHPGTKRLTSAKRSKKFADRAVKVCESEALYKPDSVTAVLSRGMGQY